MENNVAKTDSSLLQKVTKQVELWNNETDGSRWFCERDRDYIDGKQWTDQQVATLKARGQAPIVVNRIKPKHEGLKGLVMLRKTDPKAYPRNPNPNDEGAAHAITDALRFVADQNDFNDTVKLGCIDEYFAEGTAAAMIDVQGEDDIRIAQIPWERFYYDPRSKKKDFSDSRFMGYFQWLDRDQMSENWPDFDFDKMVNSSSKIMVDLESRNSMSWCDSIGKRALVAVHFFIQDGKWQMCIFNNGDFLIEPELSPYLDDEGEPMNPIEAITAYIDRDGNRYGEVRSYIDQQDEINHRRSKALHLLSSRQTFSNETAGIDVKELKNEIRKPNGHISFKGMAEFGKDFGIIPNGDMTQGQFELYQDAKAELDAVFATLSGDKQSRDLSGRAIDRLQQAGTMELNGLMTQLNGWEKRVYRQVYCRIKQFWNEEKWVRVTDDQKNLRWVGLNHQVTTQEWLEEQINDKSIPEITKRPLAASYQFLMSAASQGIPDAVAKLQEIIEVKNNTNDLDVDIIIDQSYDVVNIQQEQFQVLAPLWQGTGLPITELIRLSNLPGKDEVIERIEKAMEANQNANAGAMQLQAQAAAAKNAEIISKANVNQQKAIQTGIENELLISQPQQVTSVAV